MKDLISELINTPSYKSFLDNHGSTGIYPLKELLNRSAEFTATAFRQKIQAALCVIDDTAKGVERAAHNGSTFEARRMAAQKIVSWLAERGIRRGQYCWVANKGSVFFADYWSF